VNDQERNEKLVSRQRDRAIAAILDYKERECDRYLPEEVQKMLRKIVLDHVNDLTNFCLDLLDGAMVNDLYLEKLDKILERI
jgi:hypothetical protein